MPNDLFNSFVQRTCLSLCHKTKKTNDVSSSYLSLECRVKLGEERWLVREGEHALLDHRAFDVVVLHDDVLLQHLDRVDLVSSFAFGE